MKIYFAAHSTSTDNESGLASGWKDDVLSELGIRQSKELGDRFKDIHVDLICCSDLKRASETVAIAFGDTIPVIIDKRLRELNYGDLNGMPAKEVQEMKLKCIIESFPNGESYSEGVNRAQEFYKELKQNHSDKTILVVGHRVTQYGLDTLINNKDLNDLISTPFKWQPYWEYNF